MSTIFKSICIYKIVIYMYCLYMYKLRSSYLGQLILHVGKDVQEASHCVPQSAVCKSQLVQRARALKQHSIITC